MIVTIERVDSFDLRDLLGYDASPEELAIHAPCLKDSTAIWLGRADGAPAAAAGVIPYGSVFSSRAYIWLIHTRICEQHPLRFIRWSRKVLDEIRRDYPIIVGLCKCDSEHSQAWLRWLGAEFDFSSRPLECFRFRIG